MEIVQAFTTSPIPKIYQYCMDQVKAIVPDGLDYTLVRYETPMNNASKDRFGSSALRLKLLEENLDRFWLDSDMLISSKFFEFEFEKNKPYVFGGLCSASAIYLNNCEEALDFLKRNYDGKSCLHKAIESSNMFLKIPDEFLLHLTLGILIQMGGGKHFNCSINKDENNEFQFSWIKPFNK